MLINELELVNYTNYRHAKISLQPQINILLGANAQGKSNLIDSIFFLGLAKSHRYSQDLALIRWGQSYFRLKGKIRNLRGDFTIEHAVKKGRKIVKINGTPVAKLDILMGQFSTVVFTPDDLTLIKGGPDLRRRFLNRKIVQLSPLYYEYSLYYQRTLMQRNNLLKRGNITPAEIEVWNEQLCYYGSRIMEERNKVLTKLSPIARQIHHQLSGEKEIFDIRYHPNLGFKDHPSIGKIQKLFQQKLTDTYEEDLRKGFTAVGPHRDDFLCAINNIDVRVYGSQGQQRTSVLTLKLSMLQLMKKETGEYPVLLLDDVFSELDQSRRKYLLATVSHSIQTIISATDLSSVEKQGMEKARIFNIEQGKIL